MAIVYFLVNFLCRNAEGRFYKQYRFLKVASNSDIIVCYLGLDEVTEAEGLDRENMKLKDNQISLIKTLKELNKPIMNNDVFTFIIEFIKNTKCSTYS